jgi:hypothetical protein
LGATLAAAAAKAAPIEQQTELETLFFNPDGSSLLWDTILEYRNGLYYRFYWLIEDPLGPQTKATVGLAISADGVHWKKKSDNVEGRASSPAWLAKVNGENAYVSARRGGRGRYYVGLSYSKDLLNWQGLSDTYKFSTDPRWYEPDGRWGDFWVIPRVGGGYYGYGVSQPKGKIGLAFGESADGLHWTTLPPAEVLGTNLPIGDAVHSWLEVSAVHQAHGKYYAILGLDDLSGMSSRCIGRQWEHKCWRPGMTTFVSGMPDGPFVPAKKNRRVLIGNNSYFLRLVQVEEGVLATHHSWETDPDGWIMVGADRSYMAPLKIAAWDAEGTLRLMWWSKNDLAKKKRLELRTTPGRFASFIEDVGKLGELLIIEATVTFEGNGTLAPIGFFFGNEHKTGSVFLLRDDGTVEFGETRCGALDVLNGSIVNREIDVEGPVRVRLIKKNRMTEFYVNDYLMQTYSLPAFVDSGVGILGGSRVAELKAWHS